MTTTPDLKLIADMGVDEPTPEMIDEGVKSLRCDLDLMRRPQKRTAQRAVRNVYVTMREQARLLRAADEADGWLPIENQGGAK